MLTGKYEDLLAEYNKLKAKCDDLEESGALGESGLKKEVEAKDAEIADRGAKISELQAEVNNLNVQIAQKDGEISTLTEKVSDLQAQIERLEANKTQLEQEKAALAETFTAEQEKTHQQVDALQAKLDEIAEQLKGFAEKDEEFKELLKGFADKDAAVIEKDQIIVQKDEELGELKGQLNTYFESREKFVSDKEAFLAEKEELIKAKMAAEKKAADLDKELGDIRRKMRESGDGLLGSSMEIEQLKDKLKEKEEYVAQIEAKVQGLTTGGTGIIGDFADLTRLMKEKIVEARRNVRILVPELADFERIGLFALLDDMPQQAVINLAAAIDPDTDSELIEKLHERKVQLTNYPERNQYALNVDGAECVIAIVSTYTPDQVLGGIFTNVDALITLFKDAIMIAWAKGVKII
ncbi:MAG TPA: hypothetical protein VKK79_18325 [Candidatus Lokiarchaeia archaeon]|nr:hypothetical protein [Candidatus Lokiarchaeia archaeon]